MDNSLPRSGSLLFIQMQVVLNLSATFLWHKSPKVKIPHMSVTELYWFRAVMTHLNSVAALLGTRAPLWVSSHYRSCCSESHCPGCGLLPTCNTQRFLDLTYENSCHNVILASIWQSNVHITRRCNVQRRNLKTRTIKLHLKQPEHII